MLKGITLGILVQCISVVGYLMIANVTSILSCDKVHWRNLTPCEKSSKQGSACRPDAYLVAISTTGRSWLLGILVRHLDRGPRPLVQPVGMATRGLQLA
jgi:hypothetical protein